MALAGPFTNLVIALCLFGILRATGGPVVVSTSLAGGGPFLTSLHVDQRLAGGLST